MPERRYQVSMQTIFAVMTVMIAFWRLPGGMELLMTVAPSVLVGLAVLGVLMWCPFRARV